VPALRPLLLSCALAAPLTGCGDGESDVRRADDAPPAATIASTDEAREPAATEPTARPSQSARLRLAPVGRFANPLAVTAPPRDQRRIFVAEQGGRIRVVRGGRVLRRPFLDVSRRIVSGGEQGLLGLAFAPDYHRSRRFYVHYSNRSGDTRIVEYRARASNPDRADPGSARVVLGHRQPAPNHNGGQLAFGPDGLLYIALGDGGGQNDPHGSRGNGQNLSSRLGSILRIDPRRTGSRPYRIPAGNPFRNRRGARGEIYSYGLRNPWRFSFDRATGDLIIADVGQNAVEEINFVRRNRGRGANFGWRVWEGTRRNYPGETARGHVRPVLEHRHSAGFCSITGGYVVRDPQLPALRGQYVYGDFCEGRVRAARLRAGDASDDRALDLPAVGSISSFGQDARGRVYVVSLDGPVYRLAQG
jgi:glucose/arabinose dehydrogenase